MFDNTKKATVRTYKFYLLLIGSMLTKARDTFNVFGDMLRDGKVSKDDRFEFTQKTVDFNGKPVTLHVIDWNNESIKFDALKASAISNESVKAYLDANKLTIDPDNDAAIKSFFGSKGFVIDSVEQLPEIYHIHPPKREQAAAL